MKKVIIATAFAAAMMSSAAHATTIGVAMAQFNDNFLTVLRNGMIAYAKTLPNVTLQVEDGANDVNKQLSEIQNFVASKVDAIIVNAAGCGAILKDAGKGKGANIYVMEGILSNQSARQRTQDVHDVMATPDCNFIKIIDQQTANYQRDEAQSLMANWLTTGTKFDAVIANNDEMAIGALQAMKASGMDTKAVIVGGIDSTQDALASMKAGDLKVTVFQDAAGQGKGSVDAAVKLAKGDKVDKTVWIPFQLVTPETMSNFMKKN